MSRAERVPGISAVPLDSIERERVKNVIRLVQEELGCRLPSIEQFPRAKWDVIEEIWLGKALDTIREDRKRLSGPFGFFRHWHFPDLRQLEYDEALIRRRLEELVPGSYSND